MADDDVGEPAIEPAAQEDAIVGDGDTAVDGGEELTESALCLGLGAVDGDGPAGAPARRIVAQGEGDLPRAWATLSD